MSDVYGYCAISSLPRSRSIGKQAYRIKHYFREHLVSDHSFVNTYADDEYSRIRLPLIRRPLGNLLNLQMKRTDTIVLSLLSSIGSLRETIGTIEDWRERGIDVVTLRPRIVSQKHWRDWLGAAKNCLAIAQTRQLELVAIGRLRAAGDQRRPIRRVPLLNRSPVQRGEIPSWTIDQLQLTIATRCMTSLEAGEHLDEIAARECTGIRTATLITAARLWRSVSAAVPEHDQISVYRKCWHHGRLLSSC